MEVYITDVIARKLRYKHAVREEEVLECFQNRHSNYLRDARPEHQTEPPTLWFIAQTNRGRRLKVVFVRLSSGEAVIKSAYAPSIEEIRFYERYTKLS